MIIEQVTIIETTAKKSNYYIAHATKSDSNFRICAFLFKLSTKRGRIIIIPTIPKIERTDDSIT